MKVSILVYCEYHEKYLVSFFQSLLKQTSEIHQLVIITQQHDEKTNQLASQIKGKSPFSVQLLQTKTDSSFQGFLKGVEKVESDFYLFAYPQHPFKPQKVAFFKNTLEKDPYYHYLFANASIIDADGQVVFHDYFGISGFYERWDYYKQLTSILLKQIGFVNEFQLGISAYGAKKVTQFFADYPTFVPNCSFGDFLSIYFSIEHPEEIHEIPYVLTDYRMDENEIAELKETNQFKTAHVRDKIAWLQSYLDAATLINNKHPVVAALHKALAFHQQRLQRRNKPGLSKYALFFMDFVKGSYRKFSFHPWVEFRKDMLND